MSHLPTHVLSHVLRRFVPSSTRVLRAGLLATLLVGGARPASAQAFNYPSLQLPSASTRDYTAALVGGGGTTALFQWREGVGRGAHMQLDAGLADPKYGADPMLFVGGTFAKELLRARADQPLDLLLTAGAGVAFGGNATLFRLPVGASVGHTFDLDEGMAITPYVHPRLSLDVCGSCWRDDDSRSTLSLGFDLGAEWRVNRKFAVVVSASFNGSDVVGPDETVAFGVRWTPAALAGAGRRR